MKVYENDLEECEKETSSADEATGAKSKQQQQFEFPSNEEFKIKFNQIKSRYNNLVNLSGLYAQGYTKETWLLIILSNFFFFIRFSSLDNLSKVIDQFTNDLCKIEVKLGSQDQEAKDDLDWIIKELEVLSTLDSLFRTHENDLNEMVSLHERLKETVEKVRTKPIGENSNDLDKLTLIIKQLNTRWKSAVKAYIER